MTRPARIFLSYAHYPDEDASRARELARRLYSDGFDVRFDEIDPAAYSGWPHWTEVQLKAADKIVLVCTPTYRRRFDGELDKRGGRGVAWEGLLIRNLAYDDHSTARFVPVLLPNTSREDVVPSFLRDQPAFVFDSDYHRLIAALGEHRTSDESPPPFAPLLQRVTRELVVVQGLAEFPHEALQARIVVAEKRTPRPPELERIAAAEDRVLIELAAGEDARPRIADARREARARWWRRAGAEIPAGVVTAALSPALSGGNILVFALLILGSGILIISGLMRTLEDSGYLVAPGPAGFRYAKSILYDAASLVFAGAPTGPLRIYLVITAGACAAFWLLHLVRFGGGLEHVHFLPLQLQALPALLFGAASSGIVLARWPGRWVVVVIATLLATCLPNAGSLGEIISDEGLFDLLRTLARPRFDFGALIYATPALAPATIVAAAVAGFFGARSLPRRVALRRVWISWIGAGTITVALIALRL